MTEVEYPKDFDFKVAYEKLWGDFEKLKDFCWKETFRADAAEQKVRDAEYKRLSAAAYDGFGTANWYAQEPEEYGDYEPECS